MLFAAATAGFAADPQGFKDPATGMEFVFVKGGCYKMGNFGDDPNVKDAPAHTVCVNDFYIGKYEVTQGQWKAIMGDNPSGFPKGDNFPVESVSWNEAQKFLSKLSDKGGKAYRFPTEAEWEYAARSGGKDERFAGFNDESQAHLYSNFCDKSCIQDRWRDDTSDDGHQNIAPVGSFKPNGLGIYDMSGNLWEWSSDWMDKDYYASSPKDNPKGPDQGELKVLRGGCWSLRKGAMKTYVRGWMTPDKNFNTFGLRVALTAK
jgi:formylglycine-generating enzyme required for sulfatase activity